MRDYNIEPQIWDGDSNCEHRWKTKRTERPNASGGQSNKLFLKRKGKDNFQEFVDYSKRETKSQFCQKCSAWKGCLGLEPTFDLFIKHLCDIFDEVKRILKPSGTAWINLGDTYGGSGMGTWKSNTSPMGKQVYAMPYGSNMSARLRGKEFDKSLTLIPFRFAIEMINRGWILRNTVIWHKPNCMPSCLHPETKVWIVREDRQLFYTTLRELLEFKDWEKCKILTPLGWKSIKNIWKVKKEKYTKFEIGKNDKLITSLEHRFPISHDNRRKAYRLKEARNILTDGIKDKLLLADISKFFNEENSYFEPSLSIVLNNKKIKYDYEFGRFLGLFASEGSFTTRTKKARGYRINFAFNKNEDNLSDFIINFVRKFEIKAYKTYYKNSQNCYFNNKWMQEIISNFIKGNRATNKSLQIQDFISTPKQFRLGFFDGILQGDGYKNKNGRITFGFASKQLRDDLCIILATLGYQNSKGYSNRKDKRTKKYYECFWLQICPSYQKNRIKAGIRKFGNPYSKREYYPEFEAKTIRVRNKKIKEKEIELIDLEIDSPEHLFIINEGIVTHNSAKDRFTVDFEYLFFFVKNKKYFFESQYEPHLTQENRPDGIVRNRVFNYDSKFNLNPEAYNSPRARTHREGYNAEEHFYNPLGRNKRTVWSIERGSKGGIEEVSGEWLNSICEFCGRTMRRHFGLQSGKTRFIPCTPEGRNKRTTWSICPQPFPEAHFAVYPEALCETPLKAGCPEFVCKKCGTPKLERIKATGNQSFNIRVRDVKEGRINYSDRKATEFEIKKYNEKDYQIKSKEKEIIFGCSCQKDCETCDGDGNFYGSECPDCGFESGIVLDPFIGTGTTALVALKQNKRFIGFEINPKYIEIANKRIKPYLSQKKLIV